MLEILKVGLEDVAKCFSIDKDLYETYVQGEIAANEELRSVISTREQMTDWQDLTPLGGPGTILNGCVLYSLVRHYGLSSVLETGVSGGFYTSFLLAALKQSSGRLVSLELSDDKKEVGKLVPWKDYEGWHLIDGVDSIAHMIKNPPTTTQMCCHDSLHTMSHMLKELMLFKKCALNESFIYFDDQNSDNFWQRCLDTNAFQKPGYTIKYISGNESRLEGHLGGFIKYEKVGS